jgi:hypothetical protein
MLSSGISREQSRAPKNYRASTTTWLALFQRDALSLGVTRD